MTDELWRCSATGLASAIATKKVSCREVISAHLQRIDAINPRLNALTAIFHEQAQAAATQADQAISRGAGIGPLHGVPITIKDNIDVAGSPTSKGVVGLQHALAKRDAPIVALLKRAGAIVLGRSNMPDFGMRWHTDNALHGATLNPWSAAHTPGGSSGGEAAAIATGMSPLGIGNDMGGSTRQPAINCGICGMRPSTGKVSRIMSTLDDAPPYYEQQACVNGPLARSVADLRLALAVISQPDPGDPIWCGGTPADCPAANANRIGVIAQLPDDTIEQPVANAVRQAAESLQQAGYVLEVVDPPLLTEADQIIQQLAEFELAPYLDDVLAMISEDARAFLQWVIGRDNPSPAHYRQAIARRYTVARCWSQLMHRYPLILGPVSTMAPFKAGFDIADAASVEKLMRSFRLTELCNLLGLPAVAVSVNIDNGLPQGVQIIGRRFDDTRCLNAAEVIEHAAALAVPIDPVF